MRSPGNVIWKATPSNILTPTGAPLDQTFSQKQQLAAARQVEPFISCLSSLPQKYVGHICRKKHHANYETHTHKPTHTHARTRTYAQVVNHTRTNTDKNKGRVQNGENGVLQQNVTCFATTVRL